MVAKMAKTFQREFEFKHIYSAFTSLYCINVSYKLKYKVIYIYKKKFNCNQAIDQIM